MNARHPAADAKPPPPPRPTHGNLGGERGPRLIRPAADIAARSQSLRPQRPAFVSGCHRVWLVIVAVVGLLLTPVECVVAMGPHSLFLAPDSVARLQSGATSSPPEVHAHDHPAPADAASQTIDATAVTALSSPHPPSAAHDYDSPNNAPSPSGAGMPHAGSTTSPPRPAGFSSDAMIAFSLPGLEAALAPSNVVRPMLPTVKIPPDRFLTGPEPPPP